MPYKYIYIHLLIINGSNLNNKRNILNKVTNIRAVIYSKIRVDRERAIDHKCTESFKKKQIVHIVLPLSHRPEANSASNRNRSFLITLNRAKREKKKHKLNCNKL